MPRFSTQPLEHVLYTDKQNRDLFVLSFVCSKRQAMPQPLALLKQSVVFHPDVETEGKPRSMSITSN